MQGWATYSPQAACDPQAFLVRPARPAAGKIRGHSHMSADIICPLIDPLLTQIRQPNNPNFHFSPHSKTPFFSLKIGVSNFKFFAHIACTSRFCQYLTKNGKYSKKAHLFIPQCPLFLLSGRHIPVTFIFKCPLSPGKRK